MYYMNVKSGGLKTSTFSNVANTEILFILHKCPKFKVNISSPSYYVWGTWVIVQIFDFRFLADLQFWGLENLKNTKLAWCPGVR